jgi:RNA polymerase sigma-70 factor (ECF subfamily)
MSTFDQYSDEQLVAAIIRDEELALEVLYDRYAPIVMGVVWRMVIDRAIAEEVVQETFWRVWTKRDTYVAQRGSPKTWVFGIARNLAIDSIRRRKVRPQPAQYEEQVRQFEIEPSSQPSVEAQTGFQLRKEEIEKALLELPEEQAQVIEMAYFGGKTRREIADETGTPLGTIHTRARLALMKLRELLEEQGSGNE